MNTYENVDVIGCISSTFQELQVDTSAFSEDDSFRPFDFQMPEAVQTTGSSFPGQPHTPTYSEPFSYEGTLNFMVEKDFSKMAGLFPEHLPQTTTATATSHKYMDTSSYEGSFRAYPASEECCYGSQPYSLHIASSQKAFSHRDSGIDPYPQTSDTQTHSLYPHQHHSVYSETSEDSKQNIQLYQSHPLPPAHSHTHAPSTSLEDSPLGRRSDSHQPGRYSGYVTYPQAFYSGSPVHTGAQHGIQPHELGYSASGRQGIMYGDVSGPSTSRHFHRRPSLTIPMPPPTPEG